jgi:hypothetical protein
MLDRYRSTSAPQALAHVVEELGEALAAAGKTLRWGPKSSNPELPMDEREMNIAWLYRELADVENAAKAFRDLIDGASINEWQKRVDADLFEARKQSIRNKAVALKTEDEP